MMDDLSKGLSLRSIACLSDFRHMLAMQIIEILAVTGDDLDDDIDYHRWVSIWKDSYEELTDLINGYKAIVVPSWDAQYDQTIARRNRTLAHLKSVARYMSYARVQAKRYRFMRRMKK